MVSVSVVIPTHNCRPYLAQAVASALGQTMPDVEVIVIDNGSTDDTPAWAKDQTDPRLRYYWQPDSGCPAGSRNAGLAQATGEFVAFLDADDVWQPDKLARQLPAFANPQVGLVYAGRRAIDANNTVGEEMPTFVCPGGTELEHLLHGNFVTCSSVVVRRALLQAHGLAFRPGRKGTEDWDLWLRLALVCQFAAVTTPLLHYRLHAQNISSHTPLMAASAATTLQSFAVDVAAAITEPPRLRRLQRLIRQARSWHALRYGHQCLANHQIAAGRQLMSHALADARWSPRVWWGVLKSALAR